MAYKSPLNIGLPESPAESDPKLYAQLVPIYNSIHILNQYLDNIRQTTRGAGSDYLPYESMQFQSFFWVTASMDISEGSVATVIKGNTDTGPGGSYEDTDGAVLGAGSIDIDIDTPAGSGAIQVRMRSNVFTGIAQTTAAKGEKVQIGVGPAIFRVTGISTGDIAYAVKAVDNFSGGHTNLNKDGNIYFPGRPTDAAFLGIGVANESLFIPGTSFYYASDI